jgi:hypothetical protein
MSESTRAVERPRTITLSERISKYLSCCEPAVAGQVGHTALFKAAVALVWGFGLDPEQAWSYIQEYNTRCQPPWKDPYLKRKLEQALTHRDHRKPRGHLLGRNVSNHSILAVSDCLPKLEPTWPEPDLIAIDNIVSAGPGLYNLWESSPVRYDDGNSHTEEIIDCLFPGNPLLCVGKSSYEFATRRREVWRGRLSDLPLMVPSPALATRGKTQTGKLSEHTLEATARRVYLVIEFDFAELDRNGKPTRWTELVPKWRTSGIEVVDACAALILHLREQLSALACVTFSGGKSLHGWFRVSDLPPEHRKEFMRSAVSLGADKATWVRSQFCRIPDGQRDNGKRQTCYYLNPGKAIKI